MNDPHFGKSPLRSRLQIGLDHVGDFAWLKGVKIDAVLNFHHHDRIMRIVPRTALSVARHTPSIPQAAAQWDPAAERLPTI